VAGLITQGVLDFMTDRSFLSSPSSTGIMYSLQNLMGLAFLGIWIIFSTIAAPTIIQRAIATGSSAASDLFSGGFAAGHAAGTAGIMSLAGSIGGVSISKGSFSKGNFSAAAITKAAASGGAASMIAAMTAGETLVTASINEGRGGSSLIGSLARMNSRGRDGGNSGGSSNQKPSRGGFPPDDPAGDKTVGDMIRKTKNPDS
jgi:hypothetical protein